MTSFMNAPTGGRLNFCYMHWVQYLMGTILDANRQGFLSGLESDIFSGVQVNFFKRGERSK